MIVRDIKSVLFVDIETVPYYEEYDQLPDILKDCWISKINKDGNLSSQQEEEAYYEKSALFPEFLKVVCVSFGVYNSTGGLQYKSIVGSNEIEILTESAAIITKHFNSTSTRHLCAFNGKGFDFPVLSKRMFLQNVALPQALITHDKKPWELTHFIDPCELWKFGSQGTASLKLLTFLMLGIDAKELMSGADVRGYALEERWEEIQQYCEMDVRNLANVFVLMNERL